MLTGIGCCHIVLCVMIVVDDGMVNGYAVKLYSKNICTFVVVMLMPSRCLLCLAMSKLCATVTVTSILWLFADNNT